MPCPRPAQRALVQRQSLLLAALVAFVLSHSLAAAADGERRGRSAAREGVKMALHYDLFLSEGAHISDASGNNRDGVLKNGEIVLGKRKNAIKFDGKGLVLATDSADPLQLESRALTVGALCNPAAPDGVVVSMGDNVNGFSLYLKGGVPHFAVRSAGKLTEVADIDPVTLNQWVHLIGAVDARGEVWLIVNTWPVAHAKGKQLAKTPTEPFCVGADSGSPVGTYETPLHWQGLVEDIRLYWGFMDRETDGDTMKDWGDMPGCGCGK